MNRSKIAIGVGVAVLVVGLIVANYMGFFKTPTGREARKAEREALLKEDRKNLQKANATEDEVRNALMRLGAARDPLALEEALKRTEDPSDLVRSAVAFALGRFQDPRGLEALKGLLQDASAEVRRDSIRAVGSQSTEDRKAILIPLKNKKDMSASERVALWEVFLRWESDAKWRAEAFAELTAFARSEDASVKLQATALLASKFKGDARVVSVLKEKFLNSKDPQDKVIAFHHLLSMKDPWVLENYRKLSIDSSSPELQNLGIQLISRACPPKYWDILDQKISGASAPLDLKTAVLQAVAGLGGAEASQRLEGWIKAGKLQEPELQATLQQVKERLEKTQGRPGRCETTPVPDSSPQAGR